MDTQCRLSLLGVVTGAQTFGWKRSMTMICSLVLKTHNVVLKMLHISSRNSHITIALGSSHHDRKRTSASEVICLVHQCLFHCIIPHQNHSALTAQVHSHHRAIAFTELEVTQSIKHTFDPCTAMQRTNKSEHTSALQGSKQISLD